MAINKLVLCCLRTNLVKMSCTIFTLMVVVVLDLDLLVIKLL